ncbi:MAG: hypothetical protein IPQ24_04230 [Anaeromyxobacter sp.]|nr:hypothetical protein [Anaeromyxobacter sp.]
MALTRIFRRQEAPPSGGHRAALEAELLARFGELHPQSRRERSMSMITGWRLALVGGLLLAAGGASQAPADVKAEIGKRIEVVSGGPLAHPVVEAAVAALQAGGRRFEVRVQGEPRGDGQVLTRIELFGETVALDEVAATLRRAVPALAGLPISVVPIEREVAGTVGEAAGRLVGLERTLSPEELKAAISAELAAEEPGAEVEVEVEEDQGGARQVRVQVRRTEVEGATAPAPAEPPAPKAP